MSTVAKTMRMTMNVPAACTVAMTMWLVGAPRVGAQAPSAPPPAPAGSTAPAPAGVVQAPAVAPNTPPSDYVIGADDILTVKIWQDEKMSGDVVVRPDGKISLSLLNEIQAAGLTPEQFREAVTVAASKFIEGPPTVDVIVKQINSRRVFVTGEVNKPGPYPLSSRMTVMQMVAMAGGPTQYADKSKVTILRTENGKTTILKVNYNDIMKGNGKALTQNYELKVGDIVNVPE